MKVIITLENEQEFNKFVAGINQPQAAGDTQDEERTFTAEQADRYAVASQLATVCEYLEDSELIKIRLILAKCEARKEREEKS